MSATIHDWEKDIVKMSHDEAYNLAHAIGTLENWEFFKKAFGWTGIGTVRALLEEKLDGRLTESMVIEDEEASA